MILDLTVAFDDDMVLIEGDPPPKVTEAASIAEHGVAMQTVEMLNHIGTHIDAPAHMIGGGKTLDAYPVDRFVGPGKVIDVSGGYDVALIVDADVLAGDVVLIHNSAQNAADPPQMTPEFAQALIDTNIKMVGVESITLDHDEDFPLHKAFLSADILIIEGLTNVSQLIDKDSTIYALPINLPLDGAPARVIAQTDG